MRVHIWLLLLIPVSYPMFPLQISSDLSKCRISSSQWLDIPVQIMSTLLCAGVFVVNTKSITMAQCLTPYFTVTGLRNPIPTQDFLYALTTYARI
ncbi:hypothetical protein BGX38DRAFT_580860 [Terfezia claveryi]|nr:hypothetical protein BGX38DRAFT_580860 [Terfezia claveryi]